MFVRADHHLFRPAAAGNQAHAHFDQPDVSLGRGVNPRGVQIDFASAAERHSLRRAHDRPRRVLDRHVDALELAHGEMNVVPLAFLRGHQQQHQICAGGKIRRLVADHHGLEFGFQSRDARMQHRDDISADRVHLGVEFAAEHAVAQIDQARARIFLHHPRALLQRFQDQYSRAAPARAQAHPTPDRNSAWFPSPIA